MFERLSFSAIGAATDTGRSATFGAKIVRIELIYETQRPCRSSERLTRLKVPQDESLRVVSSLFSTVTRRSGSLVTPGNLASVQSISKADAINGNIEFFSLRRDIDVTLTS